MSAVNKRGVIVSYETTATFDYFSDSAIYKVSLIDEDGKPFDAKFKVGALFTMFWGEYRRLLNTEYQETMKGSDILTFDN